MEFDYYRAAFRKKGGHALLDDEAVPFRAIKNNLRYWVADPFVFERDGETYILPSCLTICADEVLSAIQS